MPANASTLPELPFPNDKSGFWPTFSLSLAERRAIANGTTFYATSNVTGQLPLPPGATQGMNRPYLASTGKPVQVQGPSVGLPALNKQSTSPLQPVRSTARRISTPLQNAPSGSFTNPSVPLRTTAPGISSVSPGVSPRLPVPVPKGISVLSVCALIFACASVLALIVTPLILAQSYALLIVFIPAFIAVVLGIRSRFESGSPGSKAIAGVGITLSLLCALIEIIRLIAHV